jgi:hypothetical protein
MPKTRNLIMLERTLPAAVAVVVAGGAIIATSVVMRGQLARALNRAGAASASAARSLGAAVPIHRILEGAGLHKRKPAYLRGLPLIAIVGGLLAAGAAAVFLAPPWRGVSSAAVPPMESDDRSSAGTGSIPPGDSIHTGEMPPNHHV